MRNAKFVIVVLALFGIAASAGCGHGEGYRVIYDPLVITAATLPAMSSGERMDYEVPIKGGCGGPYVLELLEGALPFGLELDDANGRHHIVGAIREAGQFFFVLRLTDSSCEPFATTTVTINWNIPVGALVILGANPAIIPNALYSASTEPPATDTLKYADIDALETIVYGTFMSYEIIAAGGTAPYVLSLFDDPADPDDGGLPFGVGIALSSTNILGTPNSVGPGGRPFRCTFRVTDATGATADRKFQWKIDTPKIIIATTGLGDAKAGTTHSDSIDMVDGVPPLGIEFIDDVPGPNADPTDGDIYDDVTFQSPLAPAVNSTLGGKSITLDAVTGRSTDAHIGRSAAYLFGASRSSYPLPTDNTAVLEPYPSEGLYLIPSGSFVGVPRRRGDFTLYFHVYSTLVPNERGQHAFTRLAHHVEPSEPPVGATPPFGISTSMALENTFTGLPGDGYPTLPEAEQTILYNPDAVTHSGNGLQCLALGGVPEDGFTDAPHEGDRIPAIGETAGFYSWTFDNNWDGLGAITGFEMFEPFGLLGTETQADANGLPRQGRRQLEMTVIDSQLPLSLQNIQTQVFGMSVGPDKMVITRSSTSTAAADSWWAASERHEWNDHAQQVRKFQGFQSGPVESVLDATDLPLTHTVPTTAWTGTPPSNPLGALISGATGGNSTIDIHRPTVVATGWWDDIVGLNPKAARHGKHADWPKGYYYYGQFGTSYSSMGNWQVSVPTLDLPDGEFNTVTGNVTNPTWRALNGVYDDGGRLYVFESSSRFGIFIVREDTQIYVPFAMAKSAAVECFGDGLILTIANGRNSALQTVQCTVSPNGRFAAFKLKQDAQNFYEHAGNSQILLISLWGEKIFGETAPGDNDGATWKIIGSGVGSTGSGNRILYASSMALTNTHLYFSIGSQSASSSSSTSSSPLWYQSYRGHYLMNYQVLSAATDASLITSSDGSWTQPLQTTYHHHGPSWNSTYQLWESNLSYGNWPYHRYWSEDGMNLVENGTAPTPFRCSADGRAACFMAGPDDGTSTSDADNYSNYAWVCFQGSGARRATTTRRHCYQGSGRGYSLSHGPNEYPTWGRAAGPTTCLEIADDGLCLAFVHNERTGNIYVASSYSSSSSSSGVPWYFARDNIQMASTSNSDQWATLGSTTQRDVTGTLFGGSHKWRFGALAFTADTNPTNPNYGNDPGLVFWGGAPVYQANTSYWRYNSSQHFAGTAYCTGRADTTIKSMLSTTEGGADGEGVATYSTSNIMNPSSTSGSSTSADTASNRRYGCIQPVAGFMSKNRNFMYLCSYGAFSTSDATAFKLVGLNVSTTGTNTINGTPACEGNFPASWPSRRGFMGHYIYYPYYMLEVSFAPKHHQGLGRVAMAKDTGVVFWMANYQYAGPSRYYLYGGPPVRTYYYGAYGYGGCAVYGFNADLNGRVAQINHPANVANNTSSANWGKGAYFEVPRDGKRIAYVVKHYYFYDFHNQERVNHVKDLDFTTNSDGSLLSGGGTAFTQSADTFRLQATNGRTGESMSIPPGNSTDVWYSFRATSNETGKELVKATLDASGTSFTFDRYSSLPGRINVLHGGR